MKIRARQCLVDIAQSWIRGSRVHLWHLWRLTLATPRCRQLNKRLSLRIFSDFLVCPTNSWETGDQKCGICFVVRWLKSIQFNVKIVQFCNKVLGNINRPFVKKCNSLICEDFDVEFQTKIFVNKLRFGYLRISMIGWQWNPMKGGKYKQAVCHLRNLCLPAVSSIKDLFMCQLVSIKEAKHMGS